MKPTEVRTLIAAARRAGVMLWLQGDRLHYRAPTDGMSADLRAQLRSSREDVTAELSQPVFEKRARKTNRLALPAYFQDFWHETESNRSLANATHTVVKITGELTLGRLRTVFTQVFSRHDLLRARLALAKDLPSLLFDQYEEVPLKVVDASKYASSERASRVQSILARTIWDPFEDGALFRACLIRAAEREYLFGFVLHHVVGDLSSCHLLIRDFLIALHQGKARVGPPAARPFQYSDYLLAMSEWLSGPALQYRLGYWQEQMEAAAPVALPPDREAAPGSVARLDSICFEIDPQLRAGIAQVAMSSGVTLLAVVLAANFAALSRTLKRTDLVINPIVAGRDHPALFELVGMTVDCLPVRTLVLPEMTFLELLQRVHKAYQVACSYHVPWALLRRALREIDASSVAPLLNFIPGVYGGRRKPSDASQAAKLAVENVTVAGPEDTTSVDWKSHEVHVFDTGHVMNGKIKYLSLRYRKETIEAYIESLLLSLKAIASNPGATLAAVVN